MPRLTGQRRQEIRYRRRRARRSLNLLLLDDDLVAPEEIEDLADIAFAGHTSERHIREATLRFASNDSEEY